MKVLYVILSLFVMVAMLATSFFFAYYFDISEEGLDFIGNNTYVYVTIKFFYIIAMSLSIGGSGGKLIFKLRQLRRDK